MSRNDVPTRTRILHAALALAERVDAPLSMGAIAREANLSRQALYLAFEDKTDLFVAMLRYAEGQQGIVEERAYIRTAETGRIALERMVERQSRLGPGLKAVTDAFELLRRQDADAQTAWEDRQQDRLKGCRVLAARLRDEAALRNDIDADAAADLMWTMTAPSLWDDLVVKRGWSAADYVRWVTELLRSALLRGDDA